VSAARPAETPLRARLALLLVTDRRTARGPLDAAVARALAGGVTAVMLREKDLATAELVAIGGPVRDACRAAGALFLVNHNPEAARALGADGVHLGYGAPAAAEARRVLGGAALVGRSTHDLAELRSAAEDRADYVTFGPVWDTASKRGILAPRGPEGLAEAVRAAGAMHVLALGGVTAERAGAARAAGAAGLACIGAVLAAQDERAAAAALRAAWERSS
jgi:thiamine-phosphate diphosphorylase